MAYRRVYKVGKLEGPGECLADSAFGFWRGDRAGLSRCNARFRRRMADGWFHNGELEMGKFGGWVCDSEAPTECEPLPMRRQELPPELSSGSSLQ